MDLTTLRADAAEFWTGAIAFWSSGGWAMIAIAVLALFLFGMGVHVYLKLRETGYQRVPETDWRLWIAHPVDREGPIGEILDFVTEAPTVADASTRFQQVRATETKPFARDLLVMRICVSAAPLVGLLGTVTGMLATFGALSTGSGGDQTLGAVAGGISEALITTETGLAIALPGLFFQSMLTRKFERYKAFLAHLETVCAQALHRRLATSPEAA